MDNIKIIAMDEYFGRFKGRCPFCDTEVNVVKMNSQSLEPIQIESKCSHFKDIVIGMFLYSFGIFKGD